MSETATSAEVARVLAGLAHRLQDNPEFMAHVLATYQRQERLTDAAMAERLDTTSGMLLRLTLCKRPASESPQFSEQIREIAAYTRADAAQLANVVRQVESLEKLAERPVVPLPQEPSSQQVQLRPSPLTAARDRSEMEDDQSVRPDDDLHED